MAKKLLMTIVGLFLMLGVSFAKDIPVTFTWQTQGEADLATWTITETNEAGTPTGVTFAGTLTGGQIDCSTDETLTYPDNAETTLCWTVSVADESGNASDPSNEICLRVDDVKPGSCINFGVIKR